MHPFPQIKMQHQYGKFEDICLVAEGWSHGIVSIHFKLVSEEKEPSMRSEYQRLFNDRFFMNNEYHLCHITSRREVAHGNDWTQLIFRDTVYKSLHDETALKMRREKLADAITSRLSEIKVRTLFMHMTYICIHIYRYVLISFVTFFHS